MTGVSILPANLPTYERSVGEPVYCCESDLGSGSPFEHADRARIEVLVGGMKKAICHLCAGDLARELEQAIRLLDIELEAKWWDERGTLKSEGR